MEKREGRTMVRSVAGAAEAPGRIGRAKSGRNRAIPDRDWGMCRTLLGWRRAECGGRLVEGPAPGGDRPDLRGVWRGGRRPSQGAAVRLHRRRPRGAGRHQGGDRDAAAVGHAVAAWGGFALAGP